LPPGRVSGKFLRWKRSPKARGRYVELFPVAVETNVPSCALREKIYMDEQDKRDFVER
jgi:hypothetical protein